MTINEVTAAMPLPVLAGAPARPLPSSPPEHLDTFKPVGPGEVDPGNAQRIYDINAQLVLSAPRPPAHRPEPQSPAMAQGTPASQSGLSGTLPPIAVTHAHPTPPGSHINARA